MKKAVQFLFTTVALVFMINFAYKGKAVIWPNVNEAKASVEDTVDQKEEGTSISYSCQVGKADEKKTQIAMQNVTGKKITAVKVKINGKKKWGKNQLQGKKKFSDQSYAQVFLSAKDNQGKIQLYDVQFSYQQGKKTKTMEIHLLNPEKSDLVQLQLNEGVSYVKYLKDGQMTASTKIAELAQNAKVKAVAKKEKVEEEKRKKEEAAKKAAQAQAEAAAAAANNASAGNYNASTSSSSGSKSAKPHVVSKSPSCTGSGYDKVWSDGRTSHVGSNGKDVFD